MQEDDKKKFEFVSTKRMEIIWEYSLLPSAVVPWTQTTKGREAPLKMDTFFLEVSSGSSSTGKYDLDSYLYFNVAPEVFLGPLLFVFFCVSPVGISESGCF